MTPGLLFWHLLNFVLPALAMALLMPLAGRWVMGAWPRRWPRHVLAHLALGVLVLTLGLVLSGEDGRMLTYTVLALAAGTLEWALHRAWRGSGVALSRSPAPAKTGRRGR
ncbi:MAG: hypothetical protein RIQ38_221 [Pseudomonadota bacterium]|jgi:hypothetical protein